MKTLLKIVLVCLAWTNLASASHFHTYNQDELRAMSVLFQLCPVEATELLVEEKAKLVSGQYVGGMSPFGSVNTTYTFNFEMVASEAKLVARESVSWENKVEDRTVNCELQYIAE